MRQAAILVFIAFTACLLWFSTLHRHSLIRPIVFAQDVNGRTMIFATCKTGYGVELGSLNQDRPARIINNFVFAHCVKGFGEQQVSRELR